MKPLRQKNHVRARCRRIQQYLFYIHIRTHDPRFSHAKASPSTSSRAGRKCKKLVRRLFKHPARGMPALAHAPSPIQKVNIGAKLALLGCWSRRRQHRGLACISSCSKTSRLLDVSRGSWSFPPFRRPRSASASSR